MKRVGGARLVRASLRFTWVIACVASFAILLFASSARAQGRPELKAWVDTDTLGVGDTISVTLEAQSPGNMPSDPQIGRLPPALRLLGPPSMSTSTSIQMMNGATTAKRGLTTVWQLRAERTGKVSLGPLSVQIEGKRYGTQPVTITVLAAGQAPRHVRPPPQAQNPFDPFKGLFNFGQDIDQPAPEPQVVTDPKLALDAPRNATAFLHATIDKPSAVVGEQVTFTVLLYVETNAREPEFNDVHEAAAPDFVKRSLREDDSRADVVGTANVGGRYWTVKMVRKSALFPLKTGDLEIGPMTLAIASSRGDPEGQRQSESLHVRVIEPPLTGRPPGYALGDVGNFALAAEVAPRTVERDGAIGVTIELAGTGNLPAELTPPQRPGVEWLEPQRTEKLGATRADVFGGKRTFAYVVRLHKEGDLDLGELTLPYWDPAGSAYKVARVALGSIHVNPGATPALQAEAPPDPLPGMPQARATRSAPRAARTHVTDAPWVWLALASPTFAFAVAVGARGALRRARVRREEGAASPKTELRARVTAAEHAASANDARALDAAIARALDAATIAHANANVRGVGASDVAAKLESYGVSQAVAGEVQALLLACEAARFGDGSEMDQAQERWKRARAVIGELSK